MKTKIGNLTFKKIEGEVYLVYTNKVNNTVVDNERYLGGIVLNANVEKYCFSPSKFDTAYSDSTLKIIANFMKRLNKNLEEEND